MPKFKAGDIIKYSPENNKKFPLYASHRYRVEAISGEDYYFSNSYDAGKTWSDGSAYPAVGKYHDEECILDDPLKSFVQSKLLTMGIKI